MENEPRYAEQKKRDLYLRQKELLATLLEYGAISQVQHDKSKERQGREGTVSDGQKKL